MYCIEIWIKLHFETLKFVVSKSLVFETRHFSLHGLLVNRPTVHSDEPERQLLGAQIGLAAILGGSQACQLRALESDIQAILCTARKQTFAKSLLCVTIRRTFSVAHHWSLAGSGVVSCPIILGYAALTCFCLSVTACNQVSSASSSASISSGFGAVGFIASDVLCRRTEHWP